MPRGRYRRLLWAYPNWYRQEHGPEMLSTLLDGSGRRPSWGDALGVLGRGLRCRFLPPAGPHHVYLAAIAVVFLAFAGSAVAAVAYTAPAATPSEEEAVAVALLATGRAPVNENSPVVACTYYCPEPWTSGGDPVVTFDDPFEENRGVDHVTVSYWPPDGLLPSVAEDARTRLRADGWQVGDLTVQDDGTLRLDARKDGLSLSLVRFRSDSGSPAVRLRLERDLPALTAVTVGGLFAGALGGWALTMWVMQRHRRQVRRVRVATVLCATPVLILMALADLLQVRFMVNALLADLTWSSFEYFAVVPAMVLSMAQVFPVVGAVVIVLGMLAVGTVVLAALPIRARGAERRPDPAS